MDDSNIIIDTNIVYYLCGLSTDPTVSKGITQFLRTESQKRKIYLSSVSLFEILARYHRRANHFRRIMCTIRSYNIHIIDNEYYKKIAAFQKNLETVRQKDVDRLWSEVLERKRDVEASYTTIAFSLLLSSSTVFECIDDVFNVPEYVYAAMKSILEQSRNIALQIFKDAFYTGYQTDDCETYVRDVFSALLNYFLPLSISVCNSARNWKRDENGNVTIPDAELIRYNSSIEIISKKIRKRITPANYIMRKAREYDRKKGTTSLQDYLVNISGTIFNVVPGYSTPRYLYAIVERCVTQGSPFMKNDIIDAMILETLDDSSVLLTMDKGVIKHMADHMGNKVAYQNSLSMIQQL